MNDPVLWRVHIYQMANAATQEAVADLLGRVHDLTTESTGPLHCLTVTCRGSGQARDVHRLVTLSDPKAVLVNTTYGLSKPSALGSAPGSP